MVLRGDTIWSAASKALSAGRVKTVQLAGARREAVRRQVARGDTTWQRAQALADASKIVVLRIGEDL